MKKLIVLLICLLPSFAIAAKEKEGVKYDAKLTRVIDGDTVAYEAPWLPEPLKKELSIRVFGVDTPEKSFRAKCPQEAKKGEEATEFTKGLVKKAQKVEVILLDWDKYGGRVLGDIILDGKSLRKQLIDNGFARAYYGEAKTSWCN